MDVGIVVPNEDRVEERVLTKRRDDYDDILGPLPMKHDARHVSLPRLVQVLVLTRRPHPGLPKAILPRHRSRRTRFLRSRVVGEDVERVPPTDLDIVAAWT